MKSEKLQALKGLRILDAKQTKIFVGTSSVSYDQSRKRDGSQHDDHSRTKDTSNTDDTCDYGDR